MKKKIFLGVITILSAGLSMANDKIVSQNEPTNKSLDRSDKPPLTCAVGYGTSESPCLSVTSSYFACCTCSKDVAKFIANNLAAKDAEHRLKAALAVTKFIC